MVTIKIIRVDNDKITGREIGGENENKIIDINMNRSIYLALLTEIKKADVVIDEELDCFHNRIFTIYETKWKDTPVFGAALRKDLEYLILWKDSIDVL